MENFNLRITATEKYLKESKNKMKVLKEEGKSPEEIIEILFGNFPKDTKEMLISDLKNYL